MNSPHSPEHRESNLDRDWRAVSLMLRGIAQRLLAGENTRMPPSELVQKAMVEHILPAQAASDHPLGIGAMTNLVRRTLVDHARRKKALKRGGGLVPVSLEVFADGVASSSGAYEPEDVEAALKTYAELDPEGCEVLVLACFGRLSFPQVAQSLRIPEIRVRRHFHAARLWFRRKLATALDRI